MSKDLENMAEAYLDGLLNAKQASEFEEALMTESGSEALSQALMFRYLMSDLPPSHVDQQLVDSIYASIMEEFAQSEDSENSGFMKFIHDSLYILSYAFTGPRAAISSASNTSRDLRFFARGVENISYSLGVLRQPAMEKSKQLYRKRPSLWKVARKLLRR
jgi:hypothetical protein